MIFLQINFGIKKLPVGVFSVWRREFATTVKRHGIICMEIRARSIISTRNIITCFEMKEILVVAKLSRLLVVVAKYYAAVTVTQHQHEEKNYLVPAQGTC